MNLVTATTPAENVSANSEKPGSSRTFIMTWNPDKGQWAKRPQGYYYAVEQTAKNKAVVEDWSTGVRNQGISRGDRAFLLQRGNKGRGIIASGRIVGEIYPIPHWDQETHPGEVANNVDIEWECVLPMEDILPKDELNRELPEIYWSPPGSGVLVPEELVDRLEALWSNHLVGIGRSPADHGVAVTAVSADQVPLPAIETERSEVELSLQTTVTQMEAQLTRRFEAYLKRHHREVKRYKITPARASASLYSDIADVTENILYEAKGAANRMSVRLALGQVLDYGRFVDGSRLAVLLPELPPTDLVELLEEHNVGCVVEMRLNEFEDRTIHRRCP